MNVPFHSFLYAKEYAYDEKMDTRHFDVIVTVGSVDGDTALYNVRKNTFTGRVGATHDGDYIKRLMRAAWTGEYGNLEPAKDRMAA